MRDQAAVLRQMPSAERRPVAHVERGPSTVVVASGKGGAGKSVVSILLATTMAEEGRHVLLLEGDQNRGSLHVLLGVSRIPRLESLVTGEASPADLLTPVTDGLSLLSGDSGAEVLYALGEVDRARLHQRLNGLYDRFDAVVIDAGADLQGVVRVTAMGATRMILLTLPEPAALIDAYAVMKMVHLRVPTLPIDLLVNRVMSASEGQRAFERLAASARRFLNYELGYLGALPEEDSVRTAVRTPGGLLRPIKNSAVARVLRRAVGSSADLRKVAAIGG